jgi:LCP family protein required for cell wall assembly
MNRRQASLASDRDPTEPAYESGPQILDAPARPTSKRVPAPAEPGPLSTQLGDHSTTVLVADQAAPVTIDTSERLNVLILGVDVADRFAGNTDVVMLLSADLESGSVALISFPRDLYVADCNRSSDRLNGIYSRYGADAMLEVMTELTGQPITYYAVVNFDGFARIIDRLGGVDIDANRDFDDVVPNSDGSGDILQLSRRENHLDAARPSCTHALARTTHPVISPESAASSRSSPVSFQACCVPLLSSTFPPYSWIWAVLSNPTSPSAIS